MVVVASTGFTHIRTLLTRTVCGWMFPNMVWHLWEILFGVGFSFLDGSSTFAVIFVDNSDPYAEDLEASLAEPGGAAQTQSANSTWGSSGSRTGDAETQRLEALSAVAAHDRFPYSPLAHSVSDTAAYASPSRRQGAVLPPTSPSMSLSSTSNNTNIKFLLNPSHSMSPNIDPSIQLSDRSTALPTRPAASQRSLSHMSHTPDDNAETDFETAFLLRHYSEGPGLWYASLLVYWYKL